MKQLLLRGLALVAATVASTSLLNGVASLADRDREALAQSQQLRGAFLVAGAMGQRR